VNNQAPELSPEARRIISEARGADDPTTDDQARVKARWLASIAAVAGVSSLTEAARAAGGIGWGLKAAGTALVMAAGAIGLYVALPSDVTRDALHGDRPADAPVQRGATHGRFEKTPAGEQHALEGSARPGAEKRRAEQVALSPTSSPAAISAEAASAPGAASQLPALPIIATPPGPGIEAAPAAPSVLEPAEVPTRAGDALAVGVEAPATEAIAVHAGREEAREPKAARRTAARAVDAREVPARAKPAKAVPVEQRAAEPPAAQSAAQSGQLGEELALLSEVRSNVQDGTPGRALELLTRYRSQFGRPILGMEADALKVDALCKAGQRDLARASARAFQNDWPGSPLERRVSAACP
jgi:hypothetical protein